MTTIKDVAKEAGVSFATVSRVINRSPKVSENSIKAVRDAMEKLGFRPNPNARALASKNSQIIGVLVGDVSDSFFGSMMKAIDEEARNAGKMVIICNGYHNAEQEKDAIEFLMDRRCDSLVIHSKALSDKALVDYAKQKSSFVLVNRYIEEIADRCIDINNEHGAYTATKHLIENGHTNIGFLSTNYQIADGELRQKGYEDALRMHNLATFHYLSQTGDPTAEGGRKAMLKLMKCNPDVTAVVAYNDWMAVGALAALEELGKRIPEDVSIVGFDDGEVSKYLTPKLTTIRYPIEEIAKEATKLSISLAKDDEYNLKTNIYVPGLIQRDSVKKL